MNVLVIGGSKGIGRATALRFGSPGNRVFLNYAHDDVAALETANDIKLRGGTVTLLKGDIGDAEIVTEVMNKVKQETDKLDLIVHCAVAITPGGALEISYDDWLHAINVSNLSILNVLREGMPLLGYASTFLALSSCGAYKAIPQYAALGATKAFTEALVRYLVLELAPKGIRINVIAPGTLETDALKKVFPESYKDILSNEHVKNPSAKDLEFDDVTDVIEFLASPGAQMLQGRVIPVDGGACLL